MKQNKKKLLILDIDNTLLFAVMHKATFDAFQEDYCLLPTMDGFMHVPSKDICPGDKEKYGLLNVYLRPHVQDFLKFCQQHFSLAVFTTACLDHVAIATSYLFPDLQDGESPWQHIWTSEDCIVRDGAKHKSLQLVASEFAYKLEDILVVDDQPDVWVALGKQDIPANVIPIMAFGNEHLAINWLNDSVLPALRQFLTLLIGTEDMLAVEKYHWESRYPHIINDRVSNGDKLCIVSPYPVWAHNKAAGKNDSTWKFGYYTSLCGAEIEIREACSDLENKQLCAKCTEIAEKMIMEDNK